MWNVVFVFFWFGFGWRHGGCVRQERARKIFAQIDINNDGELTENEFIRVSTFNLGGIIIILNINVNLIFLNYKINIYASS